jgi:hypothetical protein
MRETREPPSVARNAPGQGWLGAKRQLRGLADFSRNASNQSSAESAALAVILRIESGGELQEDRKKGEFR